MEKLQFKTNINCGNCIKTITPFLDEVAAIEQWTVDTDNPSKILTVEGKDATAALVIETVEDAGFDIEVLK